MNYPTSVQDLILSFTKYPGIGNKSAERLALHTVTNFKDADFKALIKALEDVSSKLFECSECGIISETEICEICSSETRSSKVIVVVEDIKDVIAIEKSNSFNGKYHILKGLLNPINGIGPKEIRLVELIERLKKYDPEEVVLALNSTSEGEQTTRYISKLLENSGIKITKLAHGIPVGANIEYADEITISRAFSGRIGV